MTYRHKTFQRNFIITPCLVRELECVAGLRAGIAVATIHVSWIPQLQKDSH